MSRSADGSILGLLAALGSAHAGCIAETELRSAGISARRAQSLRDRGALKPVMSGVDLVSGVAFTPVVLAHAAVLRGGPSARLDGRSGLEWRGLLSAKPQLVTVSTRRTHMVGRRRMPVRIQFSDAAKPATVELCPRRRLAPADVIGGLRVAPVIDGLLALAAAGELHDLRRAWREADFRRLLATASIEAALGPGVTGTGVIRELLMTHPILGSEYETLGRAEQHLLGALLRRGCHPLVNEPIEVRGTTARPDFYLPDARLAAEVDGGGHDSPMRQAEDQTRAELLASVGIETVRYADVEVWRDVDACADAILSTAAERRARAA